MFVRRKDEENDKTKIQGRKRWNAYNEHEKEYSRTKTQELEAYHLPSVRAAVLGKRTGKRVPEKGQNPESTLYRMRVRREIGGTDYNFYNGNSRRNEHLRLFNNIRSKKIGEKI